MGGDWAHAWIDYLNCRCQKPTVLSWLFCPFPVSLRGFRDLAPTVLNGQLSFAHDVIERQLAHRETDAVRAVYDRVQNLD